MYKKMIFLCLIVNVITILASAINYLYVIKPLNADLSNRLDESTADLAVQSASIISSYSQTERVDNVDKIVSLFGKVASYLESLENIVFESYESIVLYSFIILLLACFNALSIILIIKKKKV